MLLQRIESLAERAAHVASDDVRGHDALRCELAEVAQEIRQSGRPDGEGLARCLQAAAATSLGLPHLGGDSRKEAERLLLQSVLLVFDAIKSSVEEHQAPRRSTPERLIHEMLLGELLLSLGVLTPDDVQKVRHDQIWTKLKFGQSAQRLGAASKEDVEDALELQRRARARAAGMAPRQAVDPIEALQRARNLPPPEPTGEERLGEALYRLGRIDRHELDLALKLQQMTGQPLGEALVEIGAASMEDILEGLQHQQMVRAQWAEEARREAS